MLTQTSVKRTLAYSTIAQMGFMMLQCGLGAFSVAMLHILAHSLYKAHAFLNSGNVLVESAGSRRATTQSSSEAVIASLPAAVAVSVIAVIYAALFFDINLAAKPGGILLACVLTMALTSWLWDVLRLNSVRNTLIGFAITASLAVFYMGGYYAVDQVVSASVPKMANTTYMNAVATTVVLVMFCGLFTVHSLLSTKRGRELLQPLQVHAANGFYLDAIVRRAFSQA